MKPGSESATVSAVDLVLRTVDLEVAYGRAVMALRGVNIAVERGSITALLGGNGAGKTTVLRSFSGLLGQYDAHVRGGRVEYLGSDVSNMDSAAIVRGGLALVPEGRRVFGTMTIEENLRAGGLTVKSRQARAAAILRMYELFPVLYTRRKSLAGYLSGGEQQMLAIARALMSSPSVLLLDEPSLGLAPLMIHEVAQTVRKVNEAGTTVVIVEQNAHVAIELSDYGYVIANGRVALQGTREALLANPEIQEFYLGKSEGSERRNYRDLKTYRRRKAWTP